jgi:hypothetical protein
MVLSDEGHPKVTLLGWVLFGYGCQSLLEAPQSGLAAEGWKEGERTKTTGIMGEA